MEGRRRAQYGARCHTVDFYSQHDMHIPLDSEEASSSCQWVLSVGAVAGGGVDGDGTGDVTAADCSAPASRRITTHNRRSRRPSTWLCASTICAYVACYTKPRMWSGY